MTKEEFWKQLENCAENHPEEMPSLIRDAGKEGLPVLMAVDHEEIMGCSADGKLFALCVTDRTLKIPAGRIIVEVDLDNTLYHDLVTEGFAGFAFEIKGSIYCIPWSDIFSGNPVTNIEKRL